ncbi:MAG: hypothetical protein JW940_25045 [Polyangiaceae bacterium]|nr:hypothetical protein [Polyangiaceae bacterium]
MPPTPFTAFLLGTTVVLALACGGAHESTAAADGSQGDASSRAAGGDSSAASGGAAATGGGAGLVGRDANPAAGGARDPGGTATTGGRTGAGMPQAGASGASMGDASGGSGNAGASGSGGAVGAGSGGASGNGDRGGASGSGATPGTGAGSGGGSGGASGRGAGGSGGASGAAGGVDSGPVVACAGDERPVGACNRSEPPCVVAGYECLCVPWAVDIDVPGDWKCSPLSDPACTLPEGYVTVTEAELTSDFDEYVGRNIAVVTTVRSASEGCTQLWCTEDNPCCNTCGAEYVVGGTAITLDSGETGSRFGCYGTECDYLDSCSPLELNVEYVLWGSLASETYRDWMLVEGYCEPSA